MEVNLMMDLVELLECQNKLNMKSVRFELSKLNIKDFKSSTLYEKDWK